MIQEGIGAKRPLYAHVPLILGPDKSKLSGRHGAVSVTEYQKKGYLPEAFVNYLALLGWHPTDEREMFSMKDLIHNFSLERVSKSGAVFDEEKLKWFNREYIKMLDDAKFIEHARGFLPEWIGAASDTMKRLIPVLRDKIAIFSDIEALFSAPSATNPTGGELAFVSKLSDFSAEKLLWKKNPDPKIAKAHLEECRTRLEKLRFESFTADAIKVAVWDYAEAKGRGDVLWPLRVSLTGQDKSPDPFVSASILGKDEALKRIDQAVQKLS